MKICGKASEVSWWMEPSGGPLSTQCTPSEEYWRPPLEFSKGKPLATSSARPKPKNPWGLRPLGFLAFGLALDVASGSPLENPLVDLQSSPYGVHWELSGNSLGPPFTMLPPRLSHRFSLFLPNALFYYGKREKQTNKLFSNGTLGSSVVNVSSSRYKHWQC